MNDDDLRDKIDRLRMAACDPDGPLYGSDLVPLIDDVTTELLRLLARRPAVPPEV